MPRGTILLLDGISGVTLIRSRYKRRLAECGAAEHIESFAWSRGVLHAPIFYDLWHHGHQQRATQRLVERIRHILHERAGEPLHLIGHSGGAAIITWALEQLMAHESVTSAVFLNAGLSANYDLSTALSRTDRGILAVSSWLDFFMLGWGTTLLGTMDRRHRPSAGMLGFRQIRESRLEQWHWRPSSIARMRWWGWHLSAANEGLIDAVATWLAHNESET